jgi:hypothetical protein
MSFLENLKEFFRIAQETNFDFSKVYEQTPNGVYSISLIILVLLLILFFIIRRSVKISSTVKLVSEIQNSNSFDDYDEKLTKLATELPKRGNKVAQSLNVQKKEILEKELSLLKNFTIIEKVAKYQQISSQYALIASNSAKYGLEELTGFYQETSKRLLDEDLFNEIENYYLNTNFSENDIDSVNTIIAYANNTEEPDRIIQGLIQEINKFSYAFNLDLFKFVKALAKDSSKQVYINCTRKMNETLRSDETIVSHAILNYMLENEYKQEVYTYINNLSSSIYLQDLYYKFFGKTDDIDMDLAFVANETVIEEEYKDYIDKAITNNWKDKAYIKYVIGSTRVLETIGHIHYRNVLERIEKLENEEETNKAISEALEIARRAEEIANEAKAIARQR